MNMNTVSLMGRLTAAPELKQTQSGTNVLSFSLAVENGYGERKSTAFVDCVAWRSTAEFISNYFTKGQMMALLGFIQTRTYTDKEGNKRKVTEIVVDRVFFAGDKKESVAPAQSSPPLTPASDFLNPAYGGMTVEIDDSDLPF